MYVTVIIVADSAALRHSHRSILQCQDSSEARSKCIVLRILRKQVPRAKALRKRHTLYAWRAAVLLRIRMCSQLRWQKQRLAHGENFRHRLAQERTLSASSTLLAWRPAVLLRIPYDVTYMLTLRWQKQCLAHGEDFRHRPAQERTFSASGTLLAWRPAVLLRPMLSPSTGAPLHSNWPLSTGMQFHGRTAQPLGRTTAPGCDAC